MLAVLLQAQVAGCCKLGSWFLASKAAGTGNASANLHACCPRPPAPDRSGESASPSPEASAGIGHCLVGADLNVSALASAHSLGSQAGLPIHPALWPIPVQAGFRPLAGAVPRPEPPALRANLPLLI